MKKHIKPVEGIICYTEEAPERATNSAGNAEHALRDKMIAAAKREPTYTGKEVKKLIIKALEEVGPVVFRHQMKQIINNWWKKNKKDAK